jgi:regulator of protease activity HflC (stomatin/prohibitin superfamily)
MQVQDRPAFRVNGFAALAVCLAVFAVCGVMEVRAIEATDAGDSPAAILLWMLALMVPALGLRGLVSVQPNEALVVNFAGAYVGTIREPGFSWVNPLSTRQRVSLRVRNFQSAQSKVNDAHGNPIEIAAVVVWSVVDAARATFQVDSYARFVEIQAETALRTLAARYPYDSHAEREASLRGSTDEVGDKLVHELQQRLQSAGVRIHEGRISHLAYAPEIAQAMLRRQQASAVIAARTLIVEGAVGMVEMALTKLSERNVVSLDEERKAAMVANLLVVLVSESDTQPVINAGSLY